MEQSIKIISDSSGMMITWALSILGGSILSVLSTSYVKPPDLKHRLIYLLFLPGWFFVGCSIYYGTLISRSFIALTIVKKQEIREDILDNINSYFNAQLFSINIGLAIFILWLVIFILMWIFTKHFDQTK